MKIVHSYIPLIVISAALVFISSSVGQVVFPALSKYALDVIIPGHSVDKLSQLVVITVVIFLSTGIVKIAQNYISTRVRFGAMLKLFARVYKKSLSIDTAKNPQYTNGYFLQLNVDDSYAATTALVSGLSTALIGVAQVILYTALCAWQSVEITFLALALFPLNIVFWILSARYVRPAEKEYQKTGINRKQHIISTMEQLATIKSFDAGLLLSSYYKKLLHNTARLGWSVWGKKNIVTAASTFTGFLQFGVILYALYFVIIGRITIGTFAAASLYLSALSGAFGTLFGQVNQLISDTIAMERLLDMNMHLDTSQKFSPRSKLATDTLRKADSPQYTGPVISTKELSFSYGGKSLALDAVSLAIPAKALYGITGPTGSGKSTLAALWAGLQTLSYTGSLTLRGIEYSTIAPKDIRRHVAIVQQNPQLLPCSILENMTIGKSAKDNKARLLCREFSISDTIEQLPEGYNTVVSAAPFPLSWGQIQIVAIIRGILQNPDFLILDEPTSALDAATAQMLFSVLARERADKATVLISHKISFISSCEKIAVLCGGKLCGFGSHDELLSTTPLYQTSARADHENVEMVWNKTA